MAFTKVTGPGIHTLANITSHNINSSGIITATKFVGPLEASSGSTGTFDSLTVTGNVSVGGTLTYEDVTNIDSVGILTARAGIFIDDSITHIGDTNTKIRFPAADTVTAETGGTERLRIKSDGKVGLGTNNPAYPLDIWNASTQIRIQDSDPYTANAHTLFNQSGGQLTMINRNGSGYGTFIINQQNNSGQVERFRITNTGKVGINENSPDRDLHISNTTPYIRVESTSANQPATLELYHTRGNGSDKWPVSVATDDAALTFNVATAANGSPAEKVRIDSSGRVMVGTTTAAAVLTLDNTGQTSQSLIQCEDVGGSGAHSHIVLKNTTGTVATLNTVSDNLEFRVDDATVFSNISGTEKLRITSAGNVGINTISPQDLLHIGGTSTDLRFTANQIKFDRDSAASYIDQYGTGSIVFRTTPSGSQLERLTITSAGQVLIGTDTEGAAGADELTIATSGHTGITLRSGTTSDCQIFFSDATSGAGEYQGYIYYSHGDEDLVFGTNQTERLRIRGNGNVSIASSLAVTGVTTSSAYDLSAIDKSIADTAVDIFVYDTRKDSDGGAWRKRTSHTTWYNETFDSKRGSKKEFPAVAVIVAENDTLTIYDGDDPEMPMWMVFDAGNNNGNNMIGRTNEHNTTIHMLNGLLCLGRDYFGLHMINFIDDRARFKENGYDTPYLMPIGTHRNGSNVWALDPANEGNDLNNDMVNDIAMTVLPNAPIDASTGLSIPTIAVATDIGVTVITTNDATTWENGKTWDVYMGNTTYDTVNSVQFTKDGKVVYTDHNGSQYGWMYVHDIPYQDTAITVNTQSTALSWYDTRDGGSESAQGGHGFADQDGHIYSSNAGYGVKILHTVTAPDNMIYATTTSGVTMIQENRGENRSALVAHVTHSYNTGWLHGDQKFCLSDTDDTDKTNTQTEYDRSIGAKNLTVHGTVTKTAVATGAEMVSWSFGNSESNYLKQAYTAKLQFGTASFSVMGWFKKANYSSTGFIFDRADSSGNERVAWYFESDDLKLYTYNGSDSSEIGNGTVEIGSGHDGKWIFAVSTRHSSGLMETYINGALRHSQVSTVRNVDNGDAHLIVGGRYNNASGNQFNGEIALLRMSKSVPSPEQVAKIYNDEKDLFIDNAKCALYGSSSSITALAHDEDTDTLHVGTSGGRSDFTGLNRINNTTTAVTTVISASNGLIIEQ